MRAQFLSTSLRQHEIMTPTFLLFYVPSLALWVGSRSGNGEGKRYLAVFKWVSSYQRSRSR